MLELFFVNANVPRPVSKRLPVVPCPLQNHEITRARNVIRFEASLNSQNSRPRQTPQVYFDCVLEVAVGAEGQCLSWGDDSKAP